MLLHISQTRLPEKPGNYSLQQHCTYGASIENLHRWLQMYSMSDVYILNILNLLSVNGAPDGSKDENKVNMILNALSIRNVEAQIWRRVAPIKALCLRLSGDTRAVISDARETLAEARDDPGGLACLREQMCHPLATVVPYPQWPCGRRRTSCGLKMIPHLTSSRVGCREGAPSLREEGVGEEGKRREGANSTHIYRINIYPKFFLGANTCCIFV